MLGKAEMMSIRRPPTADQAGLLGYKSDVDLVAQPARFW